MNELLERKTIILYLYYMLLIYILAVISYYLFR